MRGELFYLAILVYVYRSENNIFIILSNSQTVKIDPESLILQQIRVFWIVSGWKLRLRYCDYLILKLLYTNGVTLASYRSKKDLGQTNRLFYYKYVSNELLGIF